MLPPSAWSITERAMEPAPVPHRHEIDTYAPREPRAGAALTIRPAVARDASALAALAALDSARPLHGETLVAAVGDTPIAALELGTGRSIADPLTPSASAVELLRLRAGQLSPVARRRRPRRRALVFAHAGLHR